MICFELVGCESLADSFSLEKDPMYLKNSILILIDRLTCSGLSTRAFNDRKNRSITALS